MSADRLYRYIDCFDLYNLLERKLLRVSQATKFPDKNEGFAFILREIEGKYARAFGAPTGFDGPRIVKTLSYISCWTTEPNKVAMWLLYSKDSQGFRIQTTRAKLDAILEAYRTSYENSPDKIISFSPRHDEGIFCVTYEDFCEVKKGLETRNAEIQKKIDSLPKSSSKATSIRAFSNAVRETMKTFKYTSNPWAYKDKAYDHEKEVRAVIEFEPSDEEGDSLLGGYGDLTRLSDRFFPCIQLAICDDFIEDICIDERCADFKKEVCRSSLRKYGYSLSESHVFSSLFDEPYVN
jgi:hypothetical protein